MASQFGRLFRPKSLGVISDHKVIDFFDEESRQNIYQWSAKRLKKEQKSFWYRTKIYMISWKMITTFFEGITLMVVLSTFLTCIFTFICNKYNISFNFQASIIVSPLVFPLSFLIRGDFQRRERALEFLSEFRSSIFAIFLIFREWKSKLNVPENTVPVSLNKLLQLIVHVREYLQTRSKSKRALLVQIVYEDLSDLTQLMELYHNQKISGIVSLMSRLYFTEQSLIACFEKLRVIRDYRSPRSARSFAKIMMFITPILFSPLYVYMSDMVPVSSEWTSYLFGAITAFVFGCLQSVQDRLDDPFLGVTNDEINLDDLHVWANESLKHNENRTDVVGRFTVYTKPENGPTDPKNNVGQKYSQDNHDFIREHPYLCALNLDSSLQTIKITKTQEIPGRNRIIFLRKEEKQSEEPPPFYPIPKTDPHESLDPSLV